MPASRSAATAATGHARSAPDGSENREVALDREDGAPEGDDKDGRAAAAPVALEPRQALGGAEHEAVVGLLRHVLRLHDESAGSAARSVAPMPRQPPKRSTAKPPSVTRAVVTAEGSPG